MAPQGRARSSVGVALIALLAVVALLPPAGASSGAFTDDDGSVHERDIEAIADLGITRGCNPPSNDRFCPNNVVTRGEMAAFLNRTADLLEITAIDSLEYDGTIFERDIELLKMALPGHFLDQGGYGVGCDSSTSSFCPEEPVTRADLAVFLIDTLGFCRGFCSPSTNAFVDDEGLQYEAYIDRIAELGITQGCNPPANDRFCPDGLVRRDQMASFLVRAVEVADELGAPVPPIPTECDTVLTDEGLERIFGEPFVLDGIGPRPYGLSCTWSPAADTSHISSVRVTYQLRVAASWYEYSDAISSEYSWKHGRIEGVPEPAYADAWEPWDVYTTFCYEFGHPPYCWQGSVSAGSENLALNDLSLWDATIRAIEESWITYGNWADLAP